MFSKNYSYFFILPVILSVLAAGALLVWGLQPSIELVGGSLLEVSYPQERPSAEKVHAALAPLNVGEVRVQAAGEHEYLLRARTLTNEEKNSVEQALRQLGTMEERRFSIIGPSIGAEILSKGLIAMGLVVLSIILFIAFAFRKVSEQVSSWKYGIVTIVTLAHDVLIPVGLFAALGHFLGAEVDSLFIVALLTILGISINDTIVVFDRVRENLQRNADKHRNEDFAEIVGRSVVQTITRSINTSVTVVIVLLSLYFFGPETTRNFALTLLVGMIAGTYSSIFLASPLLVIWERYDARRKK